MATRLTFATASRGPETLRIRSGFPGMDSETVTRAPDFSCIVSLALGLSLVCLRLFAEWNVP